MKENIGHFLEKNFEKKTKTIETIKILKKIGQKFFRAGFFRKKYKKHFQKKKTKQKTKKSEKKELYE